MQNKFLNGDPMQNIRDLTFYAKLRAKSGLYPQFQMWPILPSYSTQYRYIDTQQILESR